MARTRAFLRPVLSHTARTASATAATGRAAPPVLTGRTDDVHARDAWQRDGHGGMRARGKAGGERVREIAICTAVFPERRSDGRGAGMQVVDSQTRTLAAHARKHARTQPPAVFVLVARAPRDAAVIARELFGADSNGSVVGDGIAGHKFHDQRYTTTTIGHVVRRRPAQTGRRRRRR